MTLNLQEPRVALDSKQREAQTLATPGEHKEFEYDDGLSVRLWDNIDGMWAAPIPMEQKDLSLQKGVFKCSACRFTTTHIGGSIGFGGHLDNIAKKVKGHRAAALQSIQTDKGSRISCSSCPATFQDMTNGEKHLEDWSQRLLDEHKGATRIVMQRFSLGPPPESSNGHEAVDVSVAPKARMPQPRQRGRRRGRRGGKGR